MGVPNQKTVNINKEVCDKQHLYAAINLEAMSSAMLDLTGEQFKLWCYFAKNQNNYTLELSQKAVEGFAGISAKTYQRSIATMIEKGYLVNVSGNTYNFYEIPKEDKTIQLGHFDQTNQAILTRRISHFDQRSITNITQNNTLCEDEKPTALSSSRTIRISQKEDKFVF